MPFFDLTGTSARREVRAGCATFATMAYIVVVNPQILGDAGMPREGVMVATCLAAALGSCLMGLLANYPFALAPGMGLNAFFAYSVVLGSGLSWQGALAAVFMSGAIFVVLTLSRAREALFNAIPPALKAAIGVGLGLFIALIGFKNAGLVAFNPATGSLGLVDGRYFADAELGALLPPGTGPSTPLLALFGLGLTALLYVRRVPGALLLGVLGTWAAAVGAGAVAWESVRFFGMPTGLGEVFLALDFAAALDFGLVAIVLTFVFVDLFDTLGTLVGVSSKAGFLDERGRLPRVRRALLADALATLGGSLLGTSTTTTYVESAAGVAEGGRTGLAALTTGALFLAVVFLAPLAASVPAVATAPVLVLVGALMMEPVRRIDFADPLLAIPAFLTAALTPLAFSIAEGVSAGVLSYTLLNLLGGRPDRVGWPLRLLALLLAARYFFL